jgi:hypothetical protein
MAVAVGKTYDGTHLDIRTSQFPDRQRDGIGFDADCRRVISGSQLAPGCQLIVG